MPLQAETSCLQGGEVNKKNKHYQQKKQQTIG